LPAPARELFPAGHDKAAAVVRRNPHIHLASMRSVVVSQDCAG